MFLWIKKLVNYFSLSKNEKKHKNCDNLDFEMVNFPIIGFEKFFFEKNSLFGISYHFLGIDNNPFIFSPISGFISKVYDDFCIKLENTKGLQLLLQINLKKNSFFPLKKVFRCCIFEGMQINEGEEIFYIFLDKEIKSLSLHLLHQPYLIKKIFFWEAKEKKDYLFKLYYNNFENNFDIDAWKKNPNSIYPILNYDKYLLK